MPRAGGSYRNSGRDNIPTMGPGRICRQAVRRGLVHVNLTAVPSDPVGSFLVAGSGLAEHDSGAGLTCLYNPWALAASGGEQGPLLGDWEDSKA